jgi:hypothetical protein
MTEAQQDAGRTRWFGRRTGKDAHGASPGSPERTDTPLDGERRTGWGTAPDREPVDGDTTPVARRGADADRAQLRERFGGRKVGAAFFGWLVAVGMTVILTTIATALGLAIGSSMGLDPNGADAAPIGLTGGAVLLAVLAIAYFTGGYVAGRLARFDGARNGILCWVVGLLVTVLAVVAGAVANSTSDVLAGLRLPAVPGDPSTLTVAGVIALVAVLLVTAVAAALGGRAGEQFHRRVDRAAERL